ncbi:hypothetical protein [Nocardia grenadensis]|uniref:hypothetical protein n=1 Tax=Nocardia grenadensis TaxID=931537 RepID=UPI0007A428B7|nr:hypothetical protein [Nocardia grenadensis]
MEPPEGDRAGRGIACPVVFPRGRVGLVGVGTPSPSALHRVAADPGLECVRAQGETGLKRTVEATGRTEFAFYPLPAHPGAETGSYEVRACYDRDRVKFAQVRWIDRPKDYGMVDLTATRVKPSIMTGKVEANGCTTFRVELQRG